MTKPGAAPSILRPGQNCCALEQAERFHVIQDGDYYRLFREAVLRAERTVFILSWDIHADTELVPGDPPGEVPSRLGAFLTYAARRRPKVRFFILTWDYGLLFAIERDPFTRWRLGWLTPRNVRLAFDDHHPIGACHHQKVVVIDDRLAFSGGMDLTGHRWDTPAHRVDEPARLNTRGKPYEPYHEVMTMMEGPVAARLGELARDRWRAVGVGRLPRVNATGPSLWPDQVAPDLTDVAVGIARTMPGTAGGAPVHECERLYLDAIAAARHTLYIENQYFTHPGLADALAARLREPDGPEIVLVLPRGGDGWLEDNTIRVIRDALFQQLAAADAHHRLRLVYPVASRARDVTTFVHSKVLIADDAVLIVGSANTNRRSMGMDTECDVVVAPKGQRGAAAIAAIRHRLAGEHLGLDGEQFAEAVARAGSFRHLIDARQDHDRTLALFDLTQAAPPLDDTVQAVVDPEAPLSLGPDIDRIVPNVDEADGHTPRPAWTAPAVAGLAWIPWELVFIGTGVLFGAGRGIVIAVGGSMALAVVGYAVGRRLGVAGVGRWVSRRAFRSIRQVGATGIGGVAMLQLAGVAGAGAVHLLCGAGRVPVGDYLAGTALGLVPAIVALVGLGALVGNLVLAPTAANAVIAVLAALVVSAGALAIRAFLQIRRFAPALSRQRARAELGRA